MVGHYSMLFDNFWDSVAQDSRLSQEFKEFLVKGNPVKRLSGPRS